MEEDKKLIISETPPAIKKKPELWKTAVSILALVIIGFIVIKSLFRMLIPVLVIGLLIINRDLVTIIIRQIYKLYKDETYKGLIATVVSIVLFAPFMIFLLGRSLYYFFVIKKKLAASDVKTEKTKENLTSELITISIKEKVKSVLGIDEDKDKMK